MYSLIKISSIKIFKLLLKLLRYKKKNLIERVIIEKLNVKKPRYKNNSHKRVKTSVISNPAFFTSN